MDQPLAREAIAHRIRRAMLDAGNISQRDLASKIGMSQAVLSNSLDGKRAFRTDELAAIAEALGIDPLTLLVGAVPA